MTCNIEPHRQCIWSIETESNGKRSCCFDELCICQLNYLLITAALMYTKHKVSWIIKRPFEQFVFQRRFISQSRISTREKGNKIWKFAWTLNTDLSQRQPLLLDWLITCNTTLYKTAKFCNSNDL